MTFSTDQGTSQQTVNEIQYAGMGVGALALGKIGLTVLKNAKKYFQSVIKSNGSASEDPTDDADDAENEADSELEQGAEEASEEGVEITEDVAADFTWAISDSIAGLVGVGVMGVVLVINLLEKQMYDYVRFYNATSLDIDFGIGWVKGNTGVKLGPADVGQTATVEKIGPVPAPPGVTSNESGVSYSQLQFINNEVLEGIGYVLQAKPSGDFPGFRVMVDIPNAGDNSLYVGLNDDDCTTVWNEQKNLDTNLTASVTSGKYTLSISTNQNSGKSPSPLDKTDGYNYEHCIVLSDGTVDVNPT